MDLQTKYAELLKLAASSVKNLNVTTENEVLRVSGSASESVKNQLWAIYEKIDPEMRANDLVLTIDVVEGAEEIYEIKPGDSLSKIAGKYPEMTWQKIYEANKDTIKDPNVIYPGKKIRIPV